jgi:ribosome recycling factor
MKTVTLFMFDELNEKQVERTIDISNVTVADTNAPDGWECDVIGTTEQQRKGLNAWISERGNEQHDTILTLQSWAINN